MIGQKFSIGFEEGNIIVSGTYEFWTSTATFFFVILGQTLGHGHRGNFIITQTSQCCLFGKDCSRTLRRPNILNQAIGLQKSM